VWKTAKTTLPAGDDGFIRQSLGGFLCCFRRELNVNLVGTFGMNAAFASFTELGSL
jgi:hypothetical protein